MGASFPVLGGLQDEPRKWTTAEQAACWWPAASCGLVAVALSFGRLRELQVLFCHHQAPQLLQHDFDAVRVLPLGQHRDGPRVHLQRQTDTHQGAAQKPSLSYPPWGRSTPHFTREVAVVTLTLETHSGLSNVSQAGCTALPACCAPRPLRRAMKATSAMAARAWSPGHLVRCVPQHRLVLGQEFQWNSSAA